MYSKLQKRRHSFSSVRAQTTAVSNGGGEEDDRKEMVLTTSSEHRKTALKRPQSTVLIPVTEVDDAQLFRKRLMSDQGTSTLVSSGRFNKEPEPGHLGKEGRRKSLKDMLKLKKKKKTKPLNLRQDHKVEVVIN